MLGGQCRWRVATPGGAVAARQPGREWRHILMRRRGWKRIAGDIGRRLRAASRERVDVPRGRVNWSGGMIWWLNEQAGPPAGRGRAERI